jgi:hypothetical protein
MSTMRWPGWDIGEEIDDIAIGYAVQGALNAVQGALNEVDWGRVDGIAFLESTADEVGRYLRDWWEARGYALLTSAVRREARRFDDTA